MKKVATILILLILLPLTIATTTNVIQGWETGVFDASWAKYEDGDAHVIIDTNEVHTGVYALQLDSVPSAGAEATGCSYTTIDFAGATNIDLDFWAIESSDEDNECAAGIMAINEIGDCTAYTCNGTDWYKLTDLAPGPLVWTKYSEPDIETNCAGTITSDFSIAFCHRDNWSYTSDGIFYDDIDLNYTITTPVAASPTAGITANIIFAGMLLILIPGFILLGLILYGYQNLVNGTLTMEKIFNMGVIAIFILIFTLLLAAMIQII